MNEFYADRNIHPILPPCVRIYFVASKEGVAIMMQALLTEWRRNTTNCICPASGYKTLPAVVNILILMVLLGTTITSVKAMVVTSSTDNDRVLKLLLKKLSFKSGTGSQRRLTGEEPEMPMTLFPSVGSCHPTIPFFTFGWFVWASIHPFLYFLTLCCAIQPSLSQLSYAGLCHTTMNLPSFVH